MASQWSIIVANISIDQEQFAKALRRFDVAATCAMFTAAFALGLVILTLWPSVRMGIAACIG
jgi:hypothetical protein